MAKLILATGLAAALGLSVSAASAEPATIFARANAKAAEFNRDEAECRSLAAKARYLGPETIDQPERYGLTGAVIMAIAVAGENASARAQGLRVCMRHRGYASLTLGPDEAREFQALSPGPARDAWIEAFLAHDIAERIRVALTPKVPPLPSAPDANDAFVVRGVRVDPASLALANGTVSEGGDLLTGKARPRRTAVATAEIRERTGVITHSHPAGTVFQEYLEPVPWDASVSEDRTAWCAYLRGGDFECFRSTMDGYEVAHGFGRPWMVGRAEGSNMYAHPWMNPIRLEVQPPDVGQPFDFHVAAAKIARDGVTVAAKAQRDGETVEIWSGSVKFDGQGKARLPFWDRTLVLTRDGAGLRAAFEPNDEGKAALP